MMIPAFKVVLCFAGPTPGNVVLVVIHISSVQSDVLVSMSLVNGFRSDLLVLVHNLG